ncbi:hypothetical protein [Brevibacterium casei]|uniref:hypothetical protein n=1 Tax=Brevibacterium casei TaxID=33889 RepID=UPI001643E641|nr:hypothetical protein [Brevibacterium casei]
MVNQLDFNRGLCTQTPLPTLSAIRLINPVHDPIAQSRWRNPTAPHEDVRLQHSEERLHRCIFPSSVLSTPTESNAVFPPGARTLT